MFFLMALTCCACVGEGHGSVGPGFLDARLQNLHRSKFNLGDDGLHTEGPPARGGGALSGRQAAVPINSPVAFGLEAPACGGGAPTSSCSAGLGGRHCVTAFSPLWSAGAPRRLPHAQQVGHGAASSPSCWFPYWPPRLRLCKGGALCGPLPMAPPTAEGGRLVWAIAHGPPDCGRGAPCCWFPYWPPRLRKGGALLFRLAPPTSLVQGGRLVVGSPTATTRVAPALVRPKRAPTAAGHTAIKLNYVQFLFLICYRYLIVFL
jgi:hypothetical protein